MNAQDIIDHYSMKPLPDEGGYYVETYRSRDMIRADALDGRYKSERCCCTAILYLITPESFSKMHKVKSDEIFHFYLGDPVEMLQLRPNGTGEVTIIGSGITEGNRQQVNVTNGVWQGTKLKGEGKFALLGCTVSPGFEFDDFQSGTFELLQKDYPQYEEMIRDLT